MSAAVRFALGAVFTILIGSLHAQEAGRSTPAQERSAHEESAAQLIAGGKPREGLARLELAWAEHQRTGNQLGLARVALARSAALAALGEVDEARRQVEQARRLGASDPPLLVTALSRLATMASERGDLAAGKAYLQEALSVAEAATDLGAELTVLTALGQLMDVAGQQIEGLDYRMRAIEVADRLGNDARRVSARFAASTSLLGLSRYDEALTMAQQGYDIAQRQPSLRVRASGIFQLAQANNHVWNLDRAAALWPLALQAYRDAGDQRAVALTLNQSVNTWFALGDFERAAAEGADAAALLRKVGLTIYVAETMARVALSEVRRGRLDEAAAWSARARAELPTTPVSRHLFVHNDLGLVAIEHRQFDRARADFARVLEVAREIGNVEYEWRAGWGMGRVALAEGKPADAVQHLQGVIAAIERLRQTIPAASERAAFMTQRVAPYETLVEALVDSAAAAGDSSAAAALEVAERARSRALADLLAESRARATDARVLAARKEEAAFGNRFTAIQRRVIAAADAATRASALAELQRAEQEFEALVRRTRRESPAYASLAYPQALSASEIGAMLRPDEALVEFLVTPKRGFAWAVRGDRVVSAHVPGQDALGPQIRLLQALLASSDSRAVEELGARLHAQLLAPLDSVLQGARRIIIVPDGVLQRLPFALLRSGDRWLIETHTVSMAPSATILAYLREQPRQRAAQPLLALAAPDTPAATMRAVFDLPDASAAVLPRAAREVHDARRLLEARPEDARVGPAASEGFLKTVDARSYRILHFAAHAVVDEMVPRRSAVLLAAGEQEDGLLQVNEIANLSLNADLVVLAACRSQIGRLVRGEGLLSLSRAFMHAGARGVMATLWDVSDDETSWLMRQFYREIREGLAPDEALRRAQLSALRSGGALSSPINWAAFVVTGEATTPVLDPPAPGASPRLLAGAGAVVVVILGAVVAVRRRRRRVR